MTEELLTTEVDLSNEDDPWEQNRDGGLAACQLIGLCFALLLRTRTWLVSFSCAVWQHTSGVPPTLIRKLRRGITLPHESGTTLSNIMSLSQEKKKEQREGEERTERMEKKREAREKRRT